MEKQKHAACVVSLVPIHYIHTLCQNKLIIGISNETWKRKVNKVANIQI